MSGHNTGSAPLPTEQGNEGNVEVVKNHTSLIPESGRPSLDLSDANIERLAEEAAGAPAERTPAPTEQAPAEQTQQLPELPALPGLRDGVDDGGDGGEGLTDDGEAAPVVEYLEGGRVKMGKYVGANLEEVVAQVEAGRRAAERRMHDATQEAQRWQQEVRQGFDQANQNLLQTPPQQLDERQQYLLNRQVENQVLDLAVTEPARAAQDALAFGRGDLYDQVVGAWQSVDPQAANAFHFRTQRLVMEATSKQEIANQLQAQQAPVQQQYESQQNVVQAYEAFDRELQSIGVPGGVASIEAELMQLHQHKLNNGIAPQPTTAVGHLEAMRALYRELPAARAQGLVRPVAPVGNMQQGQAHAAGGQPLTAQDAGTAATPVMPVEYQQQLDRQIAAQGVGAMLGTGSAPNELERGNGELTAEERYENEGESIASGIMRANRRRNPVRNLEHRAASRS